MEREYLKGITIRRIIRDNETRTAYQKALQGSEYTVHGGKWLEVAGHVKNISVVTLRTNYEIAQPNPRKQQVEGLAERYGVQAALVEVRATQSFLDYVRGYSAEFLMHLVVNKAWLRVRKKGDVVHLAGKLIGVSGKALLLSETEILEVK